MEKKIFLRQVIVSSILMLIILAAGIWFYSYYGLYQYAPISKETTATASGTVKDVYVDQHSYVYVEMADGNIYMLANANIGTADLRIETGYSIDQLADLLEGKEVSYLKMSRIPWIVKIYVGDTVIDNTKLTREALDESIWGGAVLCIMVYAMAIACDVVYLRGKYARYKGLERKRRKKEKRREKLTQKNQK